MRPEARRTLCALIAVCVLPVLASYGAYFLWTPKHTVNYGDLIAPTALPDDVLAGLAGGPAIDRTVLDGRWTLAYAGSGTCDAACAQALYAMRQTHIAQGKGMHRVERLWLVIDGVQPDPRLLREHGDLRVVQADNAWLDAFPAAREGVHVFVVDPRGYVMMRFPERPDVAQIISDVKRLLKFSGLG